MITVRAVRPDDAAAWAQMRAALWPEETDAEHRREIDQCFAGEFPRWPWGAFVAEDEAGRVIGFAEVSVRPYAQGCESTRVAYLEGWYVAQDARKHGAGRALVKACEAWGRAQGCSEFASDADPENHVSRAAHGAVGFDEVGLVRCFRKDL